MLLHDYNTDEDAVCDDELTVCFTIRNLDPLDFPAYAHRSQCVTIVACDPRATRLEITLATMNQLTPDELDLARIGYGMARIGEGFADDDLVSDKPCLLFVPEALRLPDDEPLQGGAELERRRAAGDLTDEYEWLWLEQGEVAQTA